MTKGLLCCLTETGTWVARYKSCVTPKKTLKLCRFALHVPRLLGMAISSGPTAPDGKLKKWKICSCPVTVLEPDSDERIVQMR